MACSAGQDVLHIVLPNHIYEGDLLVYRTETRMNKPQSSHVSRGLKSTKANYRPDIINISISQCSIGSRRPMSINISRPIIGLGIMIIEISIIIGGCSSGINNNLIPSASMHLRVGLLLTP